MRTWAVISIAALAGAAGMGVQAVAQAPRQLPTECLKAAKFDPSMGGMHPPGGAAMGAAVGTPSEGHRAMNARMGEMHMNMEIGMSAGDINVAFICGMIPHHEGAIDMAEAVIKYGDDPWVKSFAEAIKEAQTREIADMVQWLSKR